MAILDWFSRYVVAWELSNTLDTGFCLSALDRALAQATPEIFNSDQGAQFTSHDFTTRLESAGTIISMDGRGRALDNIFTERLWRTVKYEEVYLKEYDGAADAAANLRRYFRFYNHERPHQSLNNRDTRGCVLASPKANTGRKIGHAPDRPHRRSWPITDPGMKFLSARPVFRDTPR